MHKRATPNQLPARTVTCGDVIYVILLFHIPS